MPSREDLARTQESDASASRARIENQTNKLIVQAQINLIDQAINALPLPVSAGAKALGKGIYAAFKTPVKAVSNPREQEDPVKLMAFAIAFAILKAIWCFIKSLLNPLPIIGSFFPLCGDDPQLATGADQATTTAKRIAETDLFNQSTAAANNKFVTATSAGFAVSETVKARNIVNQKNNVPATASAQSSNMNSGSEGITFEEFVARTVVPASVPIVDGVGPATALVGQTSQEQTSADIPAQPTLEPQWQATDKLTEGASYEAYRRLFGL
jgi:hypothetical protein